MGFPILTNDLVEVTVRGEAEFQEVDNVFHYLVLSSTGGDSDQFLGGWKENWVGTFLPLLSPLYFLIAVSLKKISGVTGSSGADLHLVYSDEDILWGEDTDQGSRAGTEMPLFVAATTRKITPGPSDTSYFPDPATVIGDEKRFKGSTRIGPIVESDTLDSSGIYLKSDVRIEHETAMETLREMDLTVETEELTAEMIVISMLHNGAIRTNAAMEKQLAYQTVQTMRTNLYVGSQVSRKFRGHGA